MSTPLLSTYARAQNERRERQMQTAFPAKVLDWHSGDNTVRLEPQFIETWVTSDGTTRYEDAETTYIDNVPVLFPRSGTWSITFPIETGSFGLVVCTKYSLDAFRNQGNRADPGDLRRFTMSGAVFHPVNLHPNSSALSGVDSNYMNLAGNSDFIALAAKIDAFFDTYVNTAAVPQDGGEAIQTAVAAVWNGTTDTVASTKVKSS